ncbi:hypothetical protein [Gottfriedia acidiceleris]|uniref:hypothetical protein n=1 Tax=Gottfriedia acidiceleris TaxID=371036 RepID=UPI002FFFD6E5
MKKWIIVLVLFVVVLLVFESKVYYPPLPVSSVSKRVVISKLKDSPKNIVKMAEEDGYEWYITRNERGKRIDLGNGFH